MSYWSFDYQISEDDVLHYGIKGMKWGVRRTPEQLGHISKSNRPYRKTSKKLVDKGADLKIELAKDIIGRTITKSQAVPRNQDSGETNIKSGDKVYHVTGIPIEGLKSNQLYVSKDNKDNDMYAAYLGAKLKRAGFNPQQAILTLKTDLKAPSSKQQYKLFSDFFKNNKALVIRDIETWLRSKGKDSIIGKNEKDIYDQFINSVEGRSQSQKKFYDLLKSKGYNALIDEHDITGSWMQSQRPLIIMDTLHTIGDVDVKDLTVSEMKLALDRLIKGEGG